MKSLLANQVVQDLHSNDARFIDYYARASDSDRARERALGIMRTVLRARAADGLPIEDLKVADIGCNAGTQSRCWLEKGHRVHGIDVSSELVGIATKRSNIFGNRARFDVGFAESLPLQSESVDVSLMPELLEHVQDWKACLLEATRVLRVGGSLFVSTTNVLCPKQQEFNLPFYSWYPGVLKQHYLKLATTSAPQLVNFATFPAYHWFSPYSLKRFLEPLGFRVRDKFDLIDTNRKGRAARLAVSLAKALPPLRLLGHVLTPASTVIAHKVR